MVQRNTNGALDNASSKGPNLGRREASMILSALDVSVKADLVMWKSMQGTSQILYRVLTLYQPGGEGEKRLAR